MFNQIFLNEFSKENSTELKVMVLDNGAFHKSKSLIIPENIVLLFFVFASIQPKLNPAEKVWWLLKREFVCQIFENMNQLRNHIDLSIKKIIHVKAIKNLCSYKYLLHSF